MLECFFNKATGLPAETLLKRDFSTDVFPRTMRKF